jgi:hypothetical protein
MRAWGRKVHCSQGVIWAAADPVVAEGRASKRVRRSRLGFGFVIGDLRSI